MEKKDFDENPQITIKYCAFTLIYSSLLAHSNSLSEALKRSPSAQRRVWAKIQEALKEVYDAKLTDWPLATDLLVNSLRVKARVLSTKNSLAGDVLRSVISKIETDACNWDYRNDVDRWHKIGQELARYFYADDQHSIIQERLKREASLAFDWDLEAKQALIGYHEMHPFGYREMQVRRGESSSSGVITVRFSPKNDFQTYLAYPFFFMHEYVSHIYAVEINSTFFTDGWLLYAAYQFVKNLHDNLSLPVSLDPLQIDIFERHHVSSLDGNAYDGYFNAKSFYGRAESRCYPGCFHVLMHDLAALERESSPFHGDFLNRLYKQYEDNWYELEQWLKSAHCQLERIWSLFFSHLTKN